MLRDYTVVNVRDYLQKNSEGKTRQDVLEETISCFSCPINKTIETFFKRQAIEFTKKNQSVTYLVFSKKDAALVGYFTLAAKPIVVREALLSKTMQKKISRVSEYNQEQQTFHLSAYLIAQLGKNFTNEANRKITGQDLMHIARNKVKELQYMLGGMVTFIEAEANDKLIEFYVKKNNFKKFDTRNANSVQACEIVQMLGIL